MEKLKYELPADYKYEVHKCICMRPFMAYECTHCHHYFSGRLKEICQVHPSDIFLMDFRECPYCLAPNSQVKVSDLSMEQIKKIEEAALPNANDGF
ncbi:CG13380 [Drosophila busckii]|uniref:CG13380 n=1 Tax=Drosophila busckii TaxID=30019 RepID=A0A0M4EBV8_DROBS|nr:uncharacterized protein CG13380 [Drosophila busckii]ALC45028.1 CG13380 [Drosophila busckii]